MQNSQRNASQSESGNKYTPFPTRNNGAVAARTSYGRSNIGRHEERNPVSERERREPRRRDAGQVPLSTTQPQVRSSSSLSSSSTAGLVPTSSVGSISSCTSFNCQTVSERQDPQSSFCVSSSSTPESSEVYLYLYKKLPKVSCDTDLERLVRSMHGLQEGCLYYTNLDANSARALLQSEPVGTYLVRESSDPKFLFSITVKTPRGATSIRVLYFRGFFQLDCDDQMRLKMPRMVSLHTGKPFALHHIDRALHRRVISDKCLKSQCTSKVPKGMSTCEFETVMDLLDFHTTVSRDKRSAQYRWQESSRRADMIIQLTKPRRHSPPTLAHMARVTINRRLENLHFPNCSTDLLPLPAAVKLYLRAYPYKV